jgi:hypothetical protein
MSSLKDILNLPPQAAEIEFGLAAESMEKALGAARPLLRWCNAHEKALKVTFTLGRMFMHNIHQELPSVYLT